MEKKELADEIAFFDEHRNEFAGEYAGRYLLIHGEDLCGHFDTLDAAINEKWRKEGPLCRRRGNILSPAGC